MSGTMRAALASTAPAHARVVRGAPSTAGRPSAPQGAAVRGNGRRGSVAVGGVKLGSGATVADDLFSLLGDEPATPPPPSPPLPVDPPLESPPPLAPVDSVQAAVSGFSEPPAPSPTNEESFVSLLKSYAQPSEAVDSAARQAAESVVEATPTPETVVPAAPAPLPLDAGSAAPPVEEAKEAASEVTALAAKATDAMGASAADAADRLDSAQAAASAFVSDSASQAYGAFNALTGSLQENIGSAGKTAGSAFDSAYAGLNSGVEAVNASVSEAAMSVSAAVGGAAEDALEALPAPVADTLREAGPFLSKATAAVSGQPPAVSVAAAAVVLGLPAFAVYRSKYGGYAGQLSATKTLEILQNEEALLVDIRSVAERQASGIPELKRAARVKAVALPIGGVPTALRGRVEALGKLEEQITASRIAGLSALKISTTKIIIMDGNGSQSKSMARALQQLGVARPYILDGGFKAFSREGLKCLPQLSTYDASQLQVIADDVVAASEGLTAKLKDPAFAAGVTASSAAAGVALWNYHDTLEFIGVFSLLLTITRKLASYDSPADFFNEVGEAVEKVQTVASSLQPPGKPQMSSVPSSPMKEKEEP